MALRRLSRCGLPTKLLILELDWRVCLAAACIFELFHHIGCDTAFRDPPRTKPIRSLRRLADAGRRRAGAGQPLRRRHLRQDRLAARSDRLEDRPASGRRQESESRPWRSGRSSACRSSATCSRPARANGAAGSTTPTMARPTWPTSPCRATLRLRSRAAWARSAAGRSGPDLRPRRPPHLARGRRARNRQNNLRRQPNAAFSAVAADA